MLLLLISKKPSIITTFDALIIDVKLVVSTLLKLEIVKLVDCILDSVNFPTRMFYSIFHQVLRKL